MANHKRGPKKKKGSWGGYRRGAGAKPNWFKELCREEMLKNRAKGVRLVGSISRGEIQAEKVFLFEGKPVRVKTAAAHADIIKANEYLSDRAEGKPTQPIEGGGATPRMIFIMPSEEEKT